MIRLPASHRWLTLGLLGLGVLVILGAKTQSPARAAAPSVSLANYQFQPSTLTIPVHSTVTWTDNQTGTTHTVTSDDGSFNSSGNLTAGQTFSLTFDTPGTYNYHCFYHQSIGMVGSIVVQGPPPNLQPKAYLPAVFNGS